MYIQRTLISNFYTRLTKSYHALSPPVAILVALDPDALCACHILTALFKRDYIQHHVQPISGYRGLADAGKKFVRPMRTTEGGAGGIVICLGLGGLVDLEEQFGLEGDETGGNNYGGVEVWVIDARRPWNLSNVFGMPAIDQSSGTDVAQPRRGVDRGQISDGYKPGQGGIVVFDDGDITTYLEAEREAYCELAEMPELGNDDNIASDDEVSDSEHEDDTNDLPESGQRPQKRKALDGEETDSEADEGTPKKRRRSNSVGFWNLEHVAISANIVVVSVDTVDARSKASSARLAISGELTRSDQDGSLSPASVIAASPQQRQDRSARSRRRKLIKLRRKHDAVLQSYYNLGQYYSEPVSSMMFSLASDMGLADNDILWNAIIGVTSLELSGRTSKGLGLSASSSLGTSSCWNRDQGELVKAQLRDEVQRLNPPDLKDHQAGQNGIIPTTARGPTDKAIRLSPEPRLLLIRHWSLYDSMLHSPYLSAKLHIWNDGGRRRLHKLLAKMGVSLQQCKQSYTHMDMELKRGLRERLLKFAPQYGLDGLVPQQISRGEGKEGWGFVRCWGFKACLSAVDVGVIVGAILEVGEVEPHTMASNGFSMSTMATRPAHGNPSQLSTQEPTDLAGDGPTADAADRSREDAVMKRFRTAYDALDPSKSGVSKLTEHIATAQYLYRAILRTGTSLLEKKQIRHLRAFRMAVVKEGPDVALFTHPGALIKLALWVAEAVTELEGLQGKKGGELVMASLDEPRGVYVVVGLGGGAGVLAQKEKEKRRAERKKERERKRDERKQHKAEKKRLHRERLEALGEEYDSALDSESEADTESDGDDSDDSEAEEAREARSKGINRFSNAFTEVVEETKARVRLDSFEHSVAEVRKEDLAGFLEALSMKAVVG